MKLIFKGTDTKGAEPSPSTEQAPRPELVRKPSGGPKIVLKKTKSQDPVSSQNTAPTNTPKQKRSYTKKPKPEPTEPPPEAVKKTPGRKRKATWKVEEQNGEEAGSPPKKQAKAQPSLGKIRIPSLPGTIPIALHSAAPKTKAPKLAITTSIPK